MPIKALQRGGFLCVSELEENFHQLLDVDRVVGFTKVARDVDFSGFFPPSRKKDLADDNIYVFLC